MKEITSDAEEFIVVLLDSKASVFSLNPFYKLNVPDEAQIFRAKHHYEAVDIAHLVDNTFHTRIVK